MTRKTAAVQTVSPVQRRDDWPEQLDAFIRARRARGFAWGDHDCALFAADAVKAMTGTDAAFAFREGYDSAAGALKALKAAGFAGLDDAVSAALGDPLPAVTYAQRGDVAAVPLDAETAADDAGPGYATGRMGFPFALGIVLGRQIALVRPGSQGLGAVSLLAASTAWRV